MTISNLNYSNNFGDWFVATNNLIVNNNLIETGNYIKSNGTFYITSKNVGLNVSSYSVFSNTVFANTLTANTITPNTLTANTITSNTLTANTITPNTLTANTITSNTLVVVKNTTLTNAIANNITSNSLTSNTITSNTLTANTITSNTISLTGRILYNCLAPIAKTSSVANTISASDIFNNGLISNYNAVSPLILPTANSIESILPVLTTNSGFDFFILNLSGFQSITLATNTGIIITGNTIIAANTSSHFRMRRLAANSYTAYRLS